MASKESVGVIGGLLCCAFFLPGLLMYMALSRESVVEAERWAWQSWERLNCTVSDHGILYEGSCGGHVPGRACQNTGCVGVNLEWYTEVTSKPIEGEEGAQSRRLFSRRSGLRHHCFNTWVPWVSVLIPGSSSTTCAYQYGIRSYEDLFNNLEAAVAIERLGYDAGSSIQCWRATENHCVVALVDPEELIANRNWWNNVYFYLLWALLPVIVCCWVGLAYLLYQDCWPKIKVAARRKAYMDGEAAERLQRLAASDPGIRLPVGHWATWDLPKVERAARSLFEFFDRDRSGYLDVNEMGTIMGQLGIHDQRLVKRTLEQLDVDDSGLIDQNEFHDFCRQIFWHSSGDILTREHERQMQVIGARAASVSGLAKNRPLLALEGAIMLAFVAFVVWGYWNFGYRSCDTSFGRWLLGAAVMASMEFGFLGMVACLFSSVQTISTKVTWQGAFTLFHGMILIYAIVGLIMNGISQVCDPQLRNMTLSVVMLMMAGSLYVIIPATVGLWSASLAVKYGTADFSTLSLDDVSDSDSGYSDWE